MVPPERPSFQHSQRIQVAREIDGGRSLVRITVERHDPGLGWYIAQSLTLPSHQLPALRQALDELSSCLSPGCSGQTMVPFPLLLESGLPPGA